MPLHCLKWNRNSFSRPRLESEQPPDLETYPDTRDPGETGWSRRVHRRHQRRLGGTWHQGHDDRSTHRPQPTCLRPQAILESRGRSSRCGSCLLFQRPPVRSHTHTRHHDWNTSNRTFLLATSTIEPSICTSFPINSLHGRDPASSPRPRSPRKGQKCPSWRFPWRPCSRMDSFRSYSVAIPRIQIRRYAWKRILGWMTMGRGAQRPADDEVVLDERIQDGCPRRADHSERWTLSCGWNLSRGRAPNHAEGTDRILAPIRIHDHRGAIGASAMPPGVCPRCRSTSSRNSTRPTVVIMTESGLAADEVEQYVTFPDRGGQRNDGCQGRSKCQRDRAVH